jgi:tRNA A-37 threonylcarbamoyl transferase component Bud32
LTGIDAPLKAAINTALAGPYHRIQALVLQGGRKVWLKQTERLSGRMRLQKGSGSTAFARELAGLHALGALGLPAAPILAEGPDWFVTPDLGPTLRQLMWATLTPIFAAAGAALAQLHLASYRHGRPAIRDFCWDGKAVHFIDLERFSDIKSDPRGLAIDLLIFVHSLMADGENVPKTAHMLQEAAITAYRSHAPGIWAQARVTASWLRWLPTVARLRNGSRDWRAMAPTLARFRSDPE